MATHPPRDGGLDIGLPGTFRVQDSCLYLLGEDDELILPIFEEGTAVWDDDALHYGEEQYRDGDAFILAGSAVDEPRTDVTIPAACTRADLYAEDFNPEVRAP